MKFLIIFLFLISLSFIFIGNCGDNYNKKSLDNVNERLEQCREDLNVVIKNCNLKK